MRIVSYNILNGGGDRIDALTTVIAANRPDIVVLVEADDPTVVETLATRLGMHHFHGSAGTHGGAILSRWTMTAAFNRAVGNGHWMNAFVEARITDPAGVEWPIVGVHFAAHASLERESLRDKQLDALFDRLKHLQDKPHLLVGDFNSNAPSQRIDPMRCSPRTQQDWRTNGGSIPRRIIQRLLDAGYTDTLHTLSPEIANTTGTYTTTSPGQRIDYILTHSIERTNLRSAWIDQSPPTRTASDHYPIGAEIAPPSP